jgi:hypothetical protein
MPAATSNELRSRLGEVTSKLEAYCRERQWAGWDPYDALNSRWSAWGPIAGSRLARLALTQFLKRSPVNFRPLLGIEPEQNPKALALFLTAYLRLPRDGNTMHRASAEYLAGRLLEVRSPSAAYWCWGYNFPWQMRTRLVPKFSPNLVCTTFAANALLDAYEAGLSSDCLAAATSAGDYIARALYWSNGQQAAFAYPLPDIRVPIHNANFLGAALLCRLARATGERRYLHEALSVTRYSARRQREDGSWPYGDDPSQQWVDNFHTGYNLCALQSIARNVGSSEFEPVLAKGVDFFLIHFFTPDGAPKYFHDRTYPIDIHAAAQSLITLVALRDIDPAAGLLAESVLAWTMKHMWDERGYFRYRVQRLGSIRTSYMRWSQAWMLLALIEVAAAGRQPAVHE